MAKSHMGVYALAIVVLFVGFGCCHLAHGAAVGGVEAPVNLAEVQTLTFYKDRMTTSRRGQPIVQVCKPFNLYEQLKVIKDANR